MQCSAVQCQCSARKVSLCARKVSYGTGKVSHGAGRVSHGAGMVFHSARKVSYGAEKVSHGAVKVSHGAGKVSTDYCLLPESFALQESAVAYKKRFLKQLGPGVLTKSNTEKGGRLTNSLPMSTQSQVLLSLGCASASENFAAKCTKCNFIPMSTKSQPSSPRGSRGLLWCL